MSDMKCPFCRQELEYLAEDIYGNMYCPDCRDKNGFTYKASESIWQELMRTRKALDVAVDALGYYASENSWDETNRWMFVENGFEFAKDVLEQITALTKGSSNE